MDNDAAEAAPPPSPEPPQLTRNERKRRHREQQQQEQLRAAGTTASKKPLRMPASALLPLSPDDLAPRVRRCVLEYDGARFQGFQAQLGRDAMRTVQEVVEDALRRTTGETLRLRAASRTDAGVHARGQVAAFASRCTADDRAFRDALNTRLPDDVLCRQLVTCAAGEDFDPRAHATRKTYAYSIVSGGLRPVCDRGRVWFVKQALDVRRMRAAAAHFTAAPVAKDFSSFTPQKAAADGDNVCAVTSIEVREVERHESHGDGDESRQLELVFQGDRFLYKMVRNLVGTLVDVGLGRVAVESIPEILHAKNRAKAGQGAPPYGLTLVHIAYE